MSISTNSIIHYTDTIEKVKGILKEGFRIKYCTEELNTKEGHLRGAFAMVCFCDIPLSEVKNHLDSYGYYGIGLSKKWAIKLGMNPVLYIDSKSTLGQKLRLRFKALAALKDIPKTEWVADYVLLASYMKNYEGSLIRANRKDLDYRFYDEREWRYVPTADDLKGFPRVILIEDYLTKKEEYNNNIKDILIKFEPDDISYIIVKVNDEIPEVVKLLRDIYADKCTALRLEILMTKIISAEQIISDF